MMAISKIGIEWRFLEDGMVSFYAGLKDLEICFGWGNRKNNRNIQRIKPY